MTRLQFFFNVEIHQTEQRFGIFVNNIWVLELENVGFLNGKAYTMQGFDCWFFMSFFYCLCVFVCVLSSATQVTFGP